MPQFIERETRVAGPITFRQFIMLGIMGALIVLLYFALVKISFMAFIFVSTIIFVATFALAFLRVGGRPLPTVLGNFVGFFVSPKVYLWKKKELSPRIIWKKVEESGPGPVRPKQIVPELKMMEKSHLRQMSTNIETKR
ncbi:MAG: PrgI family protein [Candidatus Nealsonbacteria bacterium]|nr:PrgI family protein [Candidatus Nealsonbacteria bacterium]